MNKRIVEVLKSREFVSVATSDIDAAPYAAPKFVLKVENNFIYLVDYIVGRMYHNLRVNPRISISMMDNHCLIGYQLNGSVTILESGPEYELLVRDLTQKEMGLSVQRVIEGVTKGRAHEDFEVALPEKFVIFKVKVEEVVEIGSRGSLKREKVCE